MEWSGLIRICAMQLHIQRVWGVREEEKEEKEAKEDMRMHWRHSISLRFLCRIGVS